MYHAVHRKAAGPHGSVAGGSAGGQEESVQLETSVQVETSAEQAWQAVADVEHWPQWTPTMTEVTWLTVAGQDPGQSAAAGGGPLHPGGRARIKQPGMPKAVWEVTEVVPGTSFTWQSSSPGLRMTGRHQVRSLTGDSAEIILGLAVTGPLAPLVGLLAGRKARRSLRHEADGLKRCAEAAAGAPR